MGRREKNGFNSIVELAIRSISRSDDLRACERDHQKRRRRKKASYDLSAYEPRAFVRSIVRGARFRFTLGLPLAEGGSSERPEEMEEEEEEEEEEGEEEGVRELWSLA